jgi:hypothetical protein
MFVNFYESSSTKGKKILYTSLIHTGGSEYFKIPRISQSFFFLPSSVADINSRNPKRNNSVYTLYFFILLILCVPSGTWTDFFASTFVVPYMHVIIPSMFRTHSSIRYLRYLTVCAVILTCIIHKRSVSTAQPGQYASSKKANTHL